MPLPPLICFCHLEGLTGKERGHLYSMEACLQSIVPLSQNVTTFIDLVPSLSKCFLTIFVSWFTQTRTYGTSGFISKDPMDEGAPLFLQSLSMKPEVLHFLVCENYVMEHDKGLLFKCTTTEKAVMGLRQHPNFYCPYGEAFHHVISHLQQRTTSTRTFVLQCASS